MHEADPKQTSKVKQAIVWARQKLSDLFKNSKDSIEIEQLKEAIATTLSKILQEIIIGGELIRKPTGRQYDLEDPGSLGKHSHYIFDKMGKLYKDFERFVNRIDLNKMQQV